MYPSSLKTKIITAKLATTRDFYIHCLGVQVVEEWHEKDDVGCILALAGDRREALLEIYEGAQPDFSGLSLVSNDRPGMLQGVPAGGNPGARTREAPLGSTYLYLTAPNGISVVVFEGGF